MAGGKRQGQGDSRLFEILRSVQFQGLLPKPDRAWRDNSPLAQRTSTCAPATTRHPTSIPPRLESRLHQFNERDRDDANTHRKLPSPPPSLPWCIACLIHQAPSSPYSLQNAITKNCHLSHRSSVSPDALVVEEPTATLFRRPSSHGLPLPLSIVIRDTLLGRFVGMSYV